MCFIIRKVLWFYSMALCINLWYVCRRLVIIFGLIASRKNNWKF